MAPLALLAPLLRLMTTLPTLDTLVVGVDACRAAADDDLAYYGVAVVLARAVGAGVLDVAVVGSGLAIVVVMTF